MRHESRRNEFIYECSHSGAGTLRFAVSCSPLLRVYGMQIWHRGIIGSIRR
jgi:hypothetical protein